jgi:hypothetical protein
MAIVAISKRPSHLAGAATAKSMQVARESPKPPAEHERLSNTLRNRLHLFATGDADIQQAALVAAKSLFDSGQSR